MTGTRLCKGVRFFYSVKRRKVSLKVKDLSAYERARERALDRTAKGTPVLETL